VDCADQRQRTERQNHLLSQHVRQRQPGDNASLHSWADPPDGGVINIVPISIDFGGTEPPKYRSLSTTFTATLLHKTAYSYDAQNVIGFTIRQTRIKRRH
jgi:hypothetical protein